MLQEQRNSIVDALEEVVKTYPFLPEKPVAPCAVIMPGATFMTVNGDNFQPNHSIQWNVTILLGAGTNQSLTQGLDGLIESAVSALWANTDFDQIVVNGPSEIPLNGASYLGVTIELTIQTQGGINQWQD